MSQKKSKSKKDNVSKKSKKDKAAKLKKGQSKRKQSQNVFGEVTLDTTRSREFANHLTTLIQGNTDLETFKSFVLNVIAGTNCVPSGTALKNAKFVIEVNHSGVPQDPLETGIRIDRIEMQ